MTREEFKEALRIVASQEFADIPLNPPEHVFSQKYERKMKRLLDSLNKHGRAPLSILHKTALIAAACLIIFIASVTQIKAIREPLIEFIMKIYETFIDVDFTGNGPAFIVQEYQLNYVPEEYALTDKRASSNSIYYQYKNPSNNAIIFIQELLLNKQAFIDNEHGEITNILVADKEVLVYKSDFSIAAYWSQDGYYMKLTCIGDFDEATIISMIESVKAVETNNSTTTAVNTTTE